jgi:restriction system protein
MSPGRSGDGRIDSIGVLRLNLLSFHVFFQCKRWKGSVGASVMGISQGDGWQSRPGTVMTTERFPPRKRPPGWAPAIDLVDGDAAGETLKSISIGTSSTC